MNKPHSDIVQGDWVDRCLPVAVRPYARLMRLDRPIGTWLLLLPCWWGAALASPLGAVRLGHLALFAMGALVMRGAGCVINDMYDRDIDQKVERTRMRPLASGALSLRQAGAFLGVLLLIGLCVLLQFNGLTIVLGLASMLLVVTYPLAKRVTWWPQLILGLTFNWGVLMGWSAVRGSIELPAVALYFAGMFWTLGYDTIYAHQDLRDDMLAGVKSLALYLGACSRLWIIVFYAFSLFFLCAAGFFAQASLAFYLALSLPASHAVWQLWGWQPDDPANSLARFRSNRDFGLLVFLALLVI